MKTWKPLLAATIEDILQLMYPVLASQKFDGIRATMQGGIMLSRSLKPIPNKNVQAMFANLLDGLDGELIVGDPLAPDAYRKTTSIVMSDNKSADAVRFHVFDWYGDEPFETRLAKVFTVKHPVVIPVQHVRINNVLELEALEESLLEAGAEGVMLRSVNGRYKEGRSTLRDGILGKLKRFKDMNAEVVGTVEYENNVNAAFTNELGRTARSSEQSGKRGAGVLGKLVCKGLEAPYVGIEFGCGCGFKGADSPDGERSQLWKVRESLVGKIVKVKYFPSGSDTRPRHPVFLGWRSKIDM